MTDGLGGLVSSVTALAKMTHADLNHMLVVLRNGKPIAVVPPGKRYRPGFRVVPFGDLQAFQINLAPVRLAMTLRDVPVRREKHGPQFHLPKVVFRASVRVTDDSDYLERALVGRGLAMIDSLTDLVQGELRGRVSSLIRSKTHQEIWEGQLDDLLMEVDSLVERTITVDHIGNVDCTPDPRFREMLDEEAEEALITVRTGLEAHKATEAAKVMVASENAEAAALGARIMLLRGIAEQHSLHLPYLLDPELEKIESGQRQEIMMQILSDPTLLRRNPGLETAVQGHLARISSSIVRGLEPVPLTSPSISAPMELMGSVGPLMTPSLRLPDDVTGSFWAAHAAELDVPLAEVVGLAAARVERHVALLGVSRQGAAFCRPMPTACAELDADVVTVCVTPHLTSLEDFVSGYLNLRMTDVPTGSVTWRPSLVGNRLQLAIASQTVRASRIKRAVSETKRLILQPLAAVLPYDGLDIVLQDE